MPSEEQIKKLHKKYAPNDKVYGLVYPHCQVVCEIAEWCASRSEKKIDVELLRAACLLHDVGTYVMFDEDGRVQSHRMYPQHAILGAKIVLDEGFDPRISNLIETHILMGLSKQEINDQRRPWPLPSRDYIPTSIEGELLCYADRFHSKRPVFNSYETFLARLKKDLPIQAARFEKFAARFGIPDVPSLAKKYDHPIA